MKTVMIVAGESSGELYGSRLASALRILWPEISIFGIGGERMKGAGVELLAGISGGLGVTELLPSLRKIREAYKTAVKALAERRPDIVVLIDYPDFNFRLARVARRFGLRVLYYVSPHVWVWRKGRVKIMSDIADRISVILPFEETIYQREGMLCEFVGHPAMEEIEEFENTVAESRDAWRRRTRADLGISGECFTIALLPGSRLNELKALLPVLQGLVTIVKNACGDVRFVLPLAPNLDETRVRHHLALLENEGVILRKGDPLTCLALSDAAVIASGTATLQAALLGTPLVVVYKVSPLTYLLGKMLLRTRFISLVNILSGKGVVPELIQERANAGDIWEELRKILYDPAYRERMISSLNGIREAFSGRRPSRRVAGIIGEMNGWKV